MRQRPDYFYRRSARQDARAFTLLESLLAVLLVGIATTAFTSALTTGLHQNHLAVQYVVATDLAAALMNEIVAKPFTDPDTPDVLTPGPEAGESSRDKFDNVDDYHGLAEPAGQMHGADNALLNDPSLALYSRSATASYVNVPGRDPALPPAFILVVVDVKYDGESLVTLKRLISSQERH